MLALALFSFLCGVVLAHRFKVLILFPAIVLGWTAVAAAGAVAEVGFWWIALAMTIVAATLQFGYLSGILARAVIVATRARRRRSSPSQSRQHPRTV